MAQQRTPCVLDSQRSTLFARVLAIALEPKASKHKNMNGGGFNKGKLRLLRQPRLEKLAAFIPKPIVNVLL
jgi:hypothetical protein